MDSQESANLLAHALPQQGGEAEFRRLLEKLPAGAYTCDAGGLITFFNTRAVDLWGRAPKLNDMTDRFCGSFKLYSVDGEPITHDRCWMALALTHGKAYNGHEIVIERPDGKRVTALAHANPIRDDQGQLSGAVNVLVDISDRKAAEAALHTTNRYKDEFLATLAHELRNPLAPLRNAVQILNLRMPRAPDTGAALAVIERQMRQMTRLIDDLMDLSRITRNKLELKLQPAKLGDIVHAALETSQPLIEAGGHRFTLKMPGEPIVLEADTARLSQVISNLLNNLGAEFVVRLPAARKRATRGTKGDSGSDARMRSPALRILVVDDNVDAAVTLAELLSIYGHDVRVAHDGPRALEEADAFRPHAVLLDIGMPKMNGYTVAKRIREGMGDEQPLLIAVTGWGQEEDRMRSQAAGFDHHLVKPVDPATLADLLNSCGPAPTLH